MFAFAQFKSFLATEKKYSIYALQFVLIVVAMAFFRKLSF